MHFEENTNVFTLSGSEYISFWTKAVHQLTQTDLRATLLTSLINQRQRSRRERWVDRLEIRLIDW